VSDMRRLSENHDHLGANQDFQSLYQERCGCTDKTAEVSENGGMHAHQSQWTNMDGSDQEARLLEFMQYGDRSFQGVNLLKAMELVDDKEPDIDQANGPDEEVMNTLGEYISQELEHIAQLYLAGKSGFRGEDYQDGVNLELDTEVVMLTEGEMNVNMAQLIDEEKEVINKEMVDIIVVVRGQ
jgi:hypothetical protein